MHIWRRIALIVAHGRLRAHSRSMDRPQKETVLITILIACGTAAFTAVFIGYVAHYDFGLSREQIRTPAVSAAVVIAVLLAVEVFSKRLRKP